MAEGARREGDSSRYPGTRTFGTSVVSARQQFSWIWSRESLLRLGLSFVLATALWLYITSKTDPTQAWDFPYPLSVTAIDFREGLTVTNNLDVVHVRVQADRSITPVAPASFHTYVDLSGYGPGTHYVNVTVLPDPGIKVLSVTPSRIPIVLAPITVQTVPVHVRMYGSPASGYRTGSWRSDPGTVTVKGPSSAVSQVTQAVAYVAIAGDTSSVNGYYQLVLQNRDSATVSSRSLTAQPSSVHVTIPVTPLSSFKTLPVIASIRGQPKAGFGVVRISINPSSITAYGSPAQLGDTSSVLTAPVRVSGRGQGTFTSRVRINLARGVHASTVWVKVKTEIQPVDASSSIEVGINPVNVRAGLVVRTRPADALVTVVGPSTAVHDAGGKLRAVLDLTGYAAGTYYLQPHIQAPGSLKVEGTYPTYVTVVLAPATTG